MYGRSEGRWVEPDLCVHHVVSLDKKLNSTLSLLAQGPVVQKPVNANLRLNIKQGFCFSC